MKKAEADNTLIKKLEQRTAEYQTQPIESDQGIPRLLGEWLMMAPWRIIVPLALAVSLGLVLLLKGLVLRGVSLLQWGF